MRAAAPRPRGVRGGAGVGGTQQRHHRVMWCNQRGRRHLRTSTVRSGTTRSTDCLAVRTSNSTNSSYVLVVSVVWWLS